MKPFGKFRKVFYNFKKIIFLEVVEIVGSLL